MTSALEIIIVLGNENREGLERIGIVPPPKVGTHGAYDASRQAPRSVIATGRAQQPTGRAPASDPPQ